MQPRCHAAKGVPTKNGFSATLRDLQKDAVAGAASDLVRYRESEPPGQGALPLFSPGASRKRDASPIHDKDRGMTQVY